MKKKNRFTIYLIIMGFVLFLTNSCKKDEKNDPSNQKPTTKDTIGQPYQGGIIAYILQSGDPGYDTNVQHGLIAAAVDQSTGANWGCSGTAIAGSEGIVLGTGFQNTISIVYVCKTAGIAARLCGDLVMGGFSDWYLPSKDELNKLCLKKDKVGGFASGFYWSSSEANNSTAWSQNFASGGQNYFPKGNSYNVRAIRTF